MSVFLAALAFCVTAQAAEPDEPPPVPPRHRLFYTNLFGGRVNPLGLTDDVELHYRLRLFEPDGLVLDDTHLSVGPALGINPAGGQVGGVVRFKPLAVLELSAMYQWVGYFGTFGLVQSFDDTSVDYSDTAINVGEDAGNNYPTTSSLLTLSALVQAKVGPIAARSSFSAVRHDINTRDGQPFWFDTTLDVLAPRQGWVLVNDVDVLYVHDLGFAVGPRWTWTDALLGTNDAADRAIHKLGLMGAVQFFDKPGAAFNAPTVVAMVQWHVQHNYRTGADVHPAIPYVAVAFLFEGDIIPWGKR